MSSSSLSNTGRPEDEYRARVAAALMARIRESVVPDAPFGHLGSSRIFCATEYDLADAVLAVRDEEIEKLHDQASKSEDAIRRVLLTLDRMVDEGPAEASSLVFVTVVGAAALDIQGPLLVGNVLRQMDEWLNARGRGEAR